MTGNTFQMGETVVIDTELEAVAASISSVDIEIRSSTNSSTIAVSGVEMEDMSNQKYRYYWDTRIGYSSSSGWSAYSSWATPSGTVWSGWSGTSGYSVAPSGLYDAKVTARDARDNIGVEYFKIRIG
jgi:hypothetical protein